MAQPWEHFTSSATICRLGLTFTVAANAHKQTSAATRLLRRQGMRCITSAGQMTAGRYFEPAVCLLNQTMTHPWGQAADCGSAGLHLSAEPAARLGHCRQTHRVQLKQTQCTCTCETRTFKPTSHHTCLGSALLSLLWLQSLRFLRGTATSTVVRIGSSHAYVLTNRGGILQGDWGRGDFAWQTYLCSWLALPRGCSNFNFECRSCSCCCPHSKKARMVVSVSGPA